MNLTDTNIRIIQSSATRTGSTLLTNILYGFFTPHLPVRYCEYFNMPPEYQGSIEDNIKDHFIIKTHNRSFEKIMSVFPEYKFYFIVSIRPAMNKHSDLWFSYLPNVIFVDYELLNATVECAVRNVYHVLNVRMQPSLVQLASIESATKRVYAMNERYEQIKDLNFEKYYDPFFKIHGHHRNRDVIGGRADRF